jgi:hypothetical protein
LKKVEWVLIDLRSIVADLHPELVSEELHFLDLSLFRILRDCNKGVVWLFREAAIGEASWSRALASVVVEVSLALIATFSVASVLVLLVESSAILSIATAISSSASAIVAASASTSSEGLALSSVVVSLSSEASSWSSSSKSLALVVVVVSALLWSLSV